MPRTGRIVLANTPHHIVQRGHNRQTVFIGDDDYRYYLDNLITFKKEFGCKVYAYCLMTNHVHLVVDPGERLDAIGLLMKRVAGRQTRYVNKLEKRSGSLWEGRYKSSIVSTKEYLPACCRYIELNPLRAAMVEDPSVYKWSSCRCKVYGEEDPAVDLPQFYLALGRSDQERQEAYRRYLYDTIPVYEVELIREAIRRGQATGGERFLQEVSQRLGQRIAN